MLHLQSAEASSLAERYGEDYFGCTFEGDSTIIRVFAPRVTNIEIAIKSNPNESVVDLLKMHRNSIGVWEFRSSQSLIGKWYAYKITPPADDLPFEKTSHFVADPYSKWVSSKNDHRQESWTLIYKAADFNWDGDTFVGSGDPRDLVIYEAHLQDLVHQDSIKHPTISCFDLLRSPDKTKAIEHIISLGVNAIEFLPLHKFAYHEPPFNSNTLEGLKNTWNPYSKNYWGYMTSYFFAPETRFSQHLETSYTDYSGLEPVGINQLKELVKTLHSHGISVIMDVVYNHVSQYDLNPLKYLDRMYYFRHDAQHHYTSYSGCGNDFKTEAPFARRLIIDSVLYWMKEFHIDGFRFDLAQLIDNETLVKIREEARKINPNVILIAEPWGGGYNPTRFSELGWPAWNDQIRNGIKGSDPIHDKGLIFGHWQRDTSRLSVENFLRGTLLHQHNGRFKRSLHSVNYLESHDGYTLGDFIRIVYNPEILSSGLKSREHAVVLSEPELNSSLLAALVLFVSQGITMIHAGQEFARTKWISPEPGVDDPETGKLDHNSYNKDNATNFIFWEDVAKNKVLFDFYCGLIEIRLNSPALRKATPESIHFTSYQDPLHFSMTIQNHGTTDPYEYFICFNANPLREHEALLPVGDFWEILVQGTKASVNPCSTLKGILKVGPLSGILARRPSVNLNQ
jgi:pullulanase/glycogen debranching enzyme